MTNEDYVKELYTAYKEGYQLSKDVFPDAVKDLEAAYKVQHAFTAAKEAAGEKLAGYKISMTSEGTQKLFDATEPLYGQITDVRVAKSVKLAETLDALIELELDFIAQEDLLAEDSDEVLLSKCLVAPGLEIPDSRYKEWFPEMSKEHVCCDGAVGGWVAYGAAQVATYESLTGIRGALVYKDEELSSATSEIVLGHPLNAVRWLVKKLAQHGLRVEKGMFISSGTFVYPEHLKKGVYEGRFENFGTATFEVK